MIYFDVSFLQLLFPLKSSTPATRLPAGQMQFAAKGTGLVLAAVFLSTLVTPMWPAGQSAPSTLSAHQTKLVAI